MSRIRIKNFGPIRKGFSENDGWIDIKKILLFIGQQASGKSTVAKAISTLKWLEKAINRGDIKQGKISFDVFERFFDYQGLKGYFGDDSVIEYQGDAYSILYDRKNEFPIISGGYNPDYNVPKIMYVPAERNFLSVVRDAFNVTGLPKPLFTFAEEFKRSQSELSGKMLQLPINDLRYRYDESSDSSMIVGSDYLINLLEASSGLHSFIPLYVVSSNLARKISESISNHSEEEQPLSVNQRIRRDEEISKMMRDNSIDPVEKFVLVDQINSKYLSRCFVNIVEEPEQNLFPPSQWELLKSLLEFNNLSANNQLIITSHSPYIINYLSIAVRAGYLANLISTGVQREKLQSIIPPSSAIAASDIDIFEFDSGKIRKLETYEGIPSDKNVLNLSLRAGNELFDSLLELEEELD